MNRGIRFVAGWLAAASTAVGLSWAVIHSAVDPGAPGRPASAASQLTGDPTVPGPGSGAPPTDAGVLGAPTATSAGGRGPARSSGAPSTAPPGASSATSVPPSGRQPSPSGPTSGPTPGSTSGATSVPTPGPGSGASAGASAGPAPAATPAADGAVRTYPVTGGRVVLRLSATQAHLISATPDDGFQVASWEADGWLRVDFSAAGTTRSSVFATWNGTAPTVRTTEY